VPYVTPNDVQPLPKYRLACVRCGWRCAPEFLVRCPICSCALDAEILVENARPQEAAYPEQSYLDFLPVESSRYLDGEVAVRTPCRQAFRLGQAIGVPNLWVKDESRQPTGSTKDRLASVVLAVFRQFGIKEWVAASTGNSSTALSRAVQRDGSMRAHFFCGRDFTDGHEIAQSERTSLTVVDGDYTAAGRVAQEFAAANRLIWEGGFFNWARREGLKIAYLEAFDQMPVQPDIVVQAISSGMGIMAAHKGAREYLRLGRLTAIPKFLMVQQDTCAPMARAWGEGRTELGDADVVGRPDGLARAILLGDSRATYPYMHDIATATGGSIISVSQAELIQARRMLEELECLDVCYSSAATVAAVRNEAAARRLDPNDVVLLNLTGRGRSTARQEP
jgi:threonine synthase